MQAHACIGGKSIGEDIRSLQMGQHIVSGTPGRVFDMIKRKELQTRCVGWRCSSGIRQQQWSSGAEAQQRCRV